MRKIPLTQGKFAVVDNEDFKWLNKHKWCAHKRGNTWYAERGKQINGKVKMLLMHREILKPKNKEQIDHINGNGLDNRKNNLRFCTVSQNKMNTNCQYGTSKYKGVYWDKNKKKWRACMGLNNKKIFLGTFQIEKDAAKAYNTAAKANYGEFAKLNII